MHRQGSLGGEQAAHSIDAMIAQSVYGWCSWSGPRM
jgi:hypothetical protein